MTLSTHAAEIVRGLGKSQADVMRRYTMRRQLVSALWARGFSETEIRECLKLDRRTVEKDLAAIRAKYQEETELPGRKRLRRRPLDTQGGRVSTTHPEA